MIDITLLKERLAALKPGLPAINKIEFVVTDDELGNLMNDFKKEENLLLAVVVPSYSGGGEEDNSEMESFLQFFLCKKVDLKVFKNQDEYVSTLQEILNVLKPFVKSLFTSENCNSFQLERNTLQINPFSRKASCMGYTIEVDEKSSKFEF